MHKLRMCVWRFSLRWLAGLQGRREGGPERPHDNQAKSALAALACGIALTVACGGSSSSSGTTGPSGGCTPSSNANTLVIQNNTICPQTLTVARGSQVTVLNSDSRAHEMDSDPHPEHTDCPELNQIGHLEPTQSRQSGNLNTARRCGMHDHTSPDVAGLKATITIQ